MRLIKKPSQRFLAVQRVRLSILAILPAFLSACFVSHRNWIWWLFTAAWVLAYFYFYIFFFPIQYHKLAYSCNSHCLLLHCGVIYTRVKAIPFTSIQYVLMISTPLERAFGVCSLVVFCAGSLSWQPGLLPQDARQLQAHLTKQMQEGA